VAPPRSPLWTANIRPPTEHVLLSLPRTGQPKQLTTRDIARIVARHAQTAEVLRIAACRNVLRHTFCAHLADSGADVATMRELAGHADIRSITICTAVSRHAWTAPLPGRAQQRRGARRAAARGQSTGSSRRVGHCQPTSAKYCHFACGRHQEEKPSLAGPSFALGLAVQHIR
jgi:hypothetical protein